MSLDRVKNFLCSKLSALALGSTQPPVQWVLGGESGQCSKLTTHLQLVPMSRKCRSIHPPPIHLHGVVLNLLSTGTALPYTLY
jgi:hypothetical protein